jgi:cytochrome P450
LRSIASLPHPPGLPLLGNALQVEPSRFHLRLEEWSQRYGPMYRIRIGPRELLVVVDLELAMQALRERPEGFRRLRSFEPVFTELGVNGVFSAEGERWRRQRRIWMASLNAQQLRGFHERLSQTTARLLRRWQRAADSGTAVDVVADLMRYTVDVTMQFALGHEANTLEQGEDVIQRHLNRIFPAVGRRVVAPFASWRYFKLPADRALESALGALRGEVERLTAAARRRLQDDPRRREAPGCFLEALLLARDADGSGLSEADVFANCVTVLLGGEDTTANTMAWVLHHFCEYPQVFAALRDEADAVMGDAPVPNPDHLPLRLPRTDAVIDETLRLRPIAPLYYLSALQDTALGEVRVPAGQDLILLVRAAAGCAPSSRPAPRFEPRLQPSGSPSEAGPLRVPTLPFGFGPRMCPGRNLALAELRSLCLMVARNFDLEAVPGRAPVAEKLNFTLVPEHLRLRFRRRPALI